MIAFIHCDLLPWRVSRSAKTDFVLPSQALLRNTLPGNGCS